MHTLQGILLDVRLPDARCSPRITAELILVLQAQYKQGRSDLELKCLALLLKIRVLPKARHRALGRLMREAWCESRTCRMPGMAALVEKCGKAERKNVENGF